MTSFRTRVVLLTAILLAGIAVFMYVYFPIQYERQARKALEDKANSIAQMTSYALSMAMDNNDRPWVYTALDAAKQNLDLAYIQVVTDDGQILASYSQKNPETWSNLPFGVDTISHQYNLLRTTADIVDARGVKHGKVSLALSLERLQNEVNRMRMAVAYVGMIIFGVGLFLIFLIASYVTTPLQKVADAAHRISDGDFSERAEIRSKDEVGALAHSFNYMVDTLEAAQQNLKAANETLEQRVAERTEALSTEVAERRRSEEALRKNEYILATAQRIAHLGSWYWDLKTEQVSWSNELCSILEIELGTFPTTLEGFLSFVDEEYRQGIGESIRTARKSSISIHHDFALVTAKGAKRFVSAHFKVLTDSEGTPSEMLAAIHDITHRKLIEDELKSVGNRLKVLSERLIDVQESERRFLAKELHDEIGQSLTVINLNLQGAIRKFNDEAFTSALNPCIEVVEQMIKQVRSLSMELHPSTLDDLGLSAALRWHTDKLASMVDVQILFTSDLEEERYEINIETTLFRIAQEAITNIIRHAKAGEAKIHLAQRDGYIVMTVQDDGVGFNTAELKDRDVTSRSLGLIGMVERASLLGGEFRIESEPGSGTYIEVILPMQSSEIPKLIPEEV